MLMKKEEIEKNLKQVNIGDEVVIVRYSSDARDTCDYMEGKVKSVTDKTLTISFVTMPDKRVKKDMIVSLKIR